MSPGPRQGHRSPWQNASLTSTIEWGASTQEWWCDVNGRRSTRIRLRSRGCVCFETEASRDRRSVFHKTTHFVWSVKTLSISWRSATSCMHFQLCHQSTRCELQILHLAPWKSAAVFPTSHFRRPAPFGLTVTSTFAESEHPAPQLESRITPHVDHSSIVVPEFISFPVGGLIDIPSGRGHSS